jgi:transcriptional regulator with XRE-family HTH domain
VELAVKLGREQSYVSKLERGVQGIEIVEFIDYCHAVGVEPGALLTTALPPSRDRPQS